MNLTNVLAGIKIAAIAMAVVLVAYLYHSLGTSKNNAVDNYNKWVTSKDSVLKLNTANYNLEKSKDSLIADEIKRAAALDIKATTATKSAATLKIKNDSLVALVDKMTFPDTCKYVLDSAKTAINGLQIERDSLRSSSNNYFNETIQLQGANKNLKLENDTLKDDNARLVSAINKVPVVKKEKILGLFPLPNRRQSAAIGGVLIIGLEVLAHNIHSIIK